MNEPATLDNVIPATTLGLSRLGWVKPVDHVTFEQWAGIMDAALAVERASPWWVGDLWNYAIAQGKEFEDRALQAIPLAESTVLNYAIVARVFPLRDRRSGLSLQHHANVVSIARKDMDRAQMCLEAAERDNLTVTAMREAMKPAAESTQLPAVASQAENPPQDTDWRDAMLQEASLFVSEFAGVLDDMGGVDQRAECLNWLERYAAKRVEAHRAQK